MGHSIQLGNKRRQEFSDHGERRVDPKNIEAFVRTLGKRLVCWFAKDLDPDLETLVPGAPFDFHEVALKSLESRSILFNKGRPTGSTTQRLNTDRTGAGANIENASPWQS